MRLYLMFNPLNSAVPKAPVQDFPAARIVQYWHSPDIPPYIAPLMDSFRYLNPWATHCVYDEAAAETFIAAHLTPREVAAFRSCAVAAMQADYFRYCALLVAGGLYADADMLCVANLQPLLSRAKRTTVFRRPNKMIGNAFFWAQNNSSAFLRMALDVATASIERRVAENVWLVTGPGIFTFLSNLHQSSSFEAFEARLRREEDEEEVLQFGGLLCEVVGRFDRLELAFADVQVADEASHWPFAIYPDIVFPYKSTDQHWANTKGSIYKLP